MSITREIVSNDPPKVRIGIGEGYVALVHKVRWWWDPRDPFMQFRSSARKLFWHITHIMHYSRE